MILPGCSQRSFRLSRSIGRCVDRDFHLQPITRFAVICPLLYFMHDANHTHYNMWHSGSGKWTTDKHKHTLNSSVCVVIVLFSADFECCVSAQCRWLCCCYRRHRRCRRYHIFDFFLLYWSSAGNFCDAHNTYHFIDVIYTIIFKLCWRYRFVSSMHSFAWHLSKYTKCVYASTHNSMPSNCSVIRLVFTNKCGHTHNKIEEKNQYLEP